MKSLFTEEARLARLLQVEAALAKAHAELGNIPEKAAKDIAGKASPNLVKLERVKEIEAEIGHDIMAVVLALSEKCDGSSQGYVHLGATSNDILDTATALQLREALKLIEEDLLKLRSVLVELAVKHKGTVMLGRTHGQAATPMTFGLKIAVYALEVDRHLQRLREARPRIAVGKMSGAVGTGAALGPKALQIQSKVMDFLDLNAEEASSQIVGRDRYAELAALLANIAASAEKFSTEVRNLQRTEIGEVAEAFEEKAQVGSSTMAHKENPVTAENICSLSRIVRAFVLPAYENVPLWHERDLTNSAAERFFLPHACILTDDVLTKTAWLFQTLRVFPERMLENIQRTKGQMAAEAVMIALVGKGIGRQEAHRLLRDASLEARRENSHLRDVLLSHPIVSKKLTKAELDKLFDPSAYIGSSKEIVEAVSKKLR